MVYRFNRISKENKKRIFFITQPIVKYVQKLLVALLGRKDFVRNHQHFKAFVSRCALFNFFSDIVKP